MTAALPELPGWTQQSEPVDGVQIDIGFVISPSFYYGPENDFSAAQWEALREPLERPAIPIVAEHFVLSVDCIGKEEELCRHYRDVLDKAARHGKDPRRGAYFWNRPVVHAPGGLVLSFPWHDHFIDGRLFIESLETGEAGEVFSYHEQGWEFELYLHEGTLYMREGDPDSGATHHNLRFAREPVKAQVPVVLARVEALIARLTREFGQDCWTTGS
jgi:hypothetical protein